MSETARTAVHGAYTLSDDPARLDLAAMHRFLVSAYWCEGIPQATLARAVRGSLCVGLYGAEGQVGLLRCVSDYATFCWVCDVYVLPAHRGRGLARAMLAFARGHPRLQGLRRWSLVTREAHPLYRGAGFAPLAFPERHMECVAPDPYRRVPG